MKVERTELTRSELRVIDRMLECARIGFPSNKYPRLNPVLHRIINKVQKMAHEAGDDNVIPMEFESLFKSIEDKEDKVIPINRRVEKLEWQLNALEGYLRLDLDDRKTVKKETRLCEMERRLQDLEEGRTRWRG